MVITVSGQQHRQKQEPVIVIVFCKQASRSMLRTEMNVIMTFRTILLLGVKTDQ